MDPNERYREHLQHEVCIRDIRDVGPQPTVLNFWQNGDSYKVLSALQTLTDLTATSVNSEMFSEICELQNLDRLIIDKLEAPTLEPLLRLTKLRYLMIVRLKPAQRMDVFSELRTLRKLWINESKEITDYSFLAGVSQVVALGVEGSIWTKQKVDSLEPFSNMRSLEALFMSSVQLRDKNLEYLAKNPNLKYLWAARFAPKSSFEALAKLMSELECPWIDECED